MDEVRTSVSNLHVDARAFDFVLRRMEVLKEENAALKARSQLEQAVLLTSKLVASTIMGSKSDAQVTLHTKLKNGLLPKPEKVEELKKHLSVSLVQTWRDHTNLGFSMLHIAAENGNLPACRLLVLDFQADMYARDLLGRTPLHLCGGKQFHHVCTFLTEHMGPHARGEFAPLDMAGYTPAAASALAPNFLDYNPEKHREFESARKNTKRHLHVLGDACVSPRRPQSSRKPAATSRGPSSVRRLQVNTVAESNAGLHHGVFTMNGWRVEMEDFVFVSNDVSQPLQSVFGVFDGHGGSLCARKCTEMLPGLLSTLDLLEDSEPELAVFAQDICRGLELGLKSLPEMQWKLVEIRPPMGNQPAETEWQIQDNSGTTCVLALCTSTLVCVVHVGDSRAALISKTSHHEDVPITRDHKIDESAFGQEEIARIELAGGKIINSKRVGVPSHDEGECKSSLGMTRALGDFWAKRGDKEIVSSLPECWVGLRKQYDSNLLVLASDGVWDVMTEMQVGEFIRQRMVDMEHDWQQISEALLNHCLSELDSQDNMSVVIVDLQAHDDNEVDKPVF